MIAPRNGTMKMRMTQPAFAAPERSRRRKMSANTVMKIQIAMNQKKKTIIVHMTSPNDHSVAINPASVSSTPRRLRYARSPEDDGRKEPVHAARRPPSHAMRHPNAGPSHDSDERRQR